MMILKNLSKTYRRRKALDRVDLTISEGISLALIGPNGSGKSTLLKSILGLVIPDTGSEISLNGTSLPGAHAYKSEIGFMPQTPRFPPHLKVRELIALLEKLHGRAALYQKKLVEDLEIYPFWNQAFGELSGGMLQKVNLLQCFMFENSIFILDEPTLGLDPQITYYLKQLIQKKKQSGKTILFTTHNLLEIEELADQMALLVEGRLYAVLSPTQCKQQRRASSLEEALYQFWNEVRVADPKVE